MRGCKLHCHLFHDPLLEWMIKLDEVDDDEVDHDEIDDDAVNDDVADNDAVNDDAVDDDEVNNDVADRVVEAVDNLGDAEDDSAGMLV